jgi:hypothetical protein
MNSEQIQKLEKSISNMEEKRARIYFLVQDTKGNAKASVRYIYQMAYTLFESGYNSIILHEKPEYSGVSDWLDEKYMTMPHNSIEGTNLEISPEDLIIIPEIYGFVMEQITKLPCGKIVLCQAYDHVYETLQPGQTWSQLGFFKCITTSEKQKEYLETMMRNVSYEVIHPFISDSFQKNPLPPKTIISIYTRDHRNTTNFIKMFYSKFPQYRWITFRDMRGLSELEFAQGLKDSFCSVWIDSPSAFGTFPLESMKMGVPVIGLTPSMVPEWMKEENGVWIENPLQFTDVIADMVQTWLEDNLKPELYTNGKETASEYTNMDNFKNEVVTLFSDFINKRKEAFEAQISE